MSTSGSPLHHLTSMAQAELQQVRVVRHDATPQRAMVAVEGRHGPYRGPSVA